ncbi:MAG: hypothetical protein JXC36_09470, partial [Candidatus Atribacteria bacterium]|nr:hypothetical protein [Candidatus Atribacteria bacterium]
NKTWMYMKNKMTIKREFYQDVTSTPHFITQINYEGCYIEHDDIYFDNLNNIDAELDTFNKTRIKSIIIDGGQRFRLTIIPTNNGGIKLKCNSDKINLPGKISLEGFFSIDGENVNEFIQKIKALIKDGKELNI